jgi:hypothetical protein
MGIADIFSKLTGKNNEKELVSGISQLFDTAQNDYTRAMQERIWFRNVLYYLGEQYLEYSKSLQTFRRRLLPDYVPTPVSNEIREYVRTVKSMLLQQKHIVTVAPNTNEREDIKAAELARQLLEWMDLANDGEFQDEKEKVALALPLFGVGFMRAFPWMDNDSWVFDKDGNLITTGEVGCENIIPFQVFVDQLGDRLNKKRWIGIQSLKSKEWVEDTFKVKITSADSKSTDYFRRLMKIVGQVSPWKGANIDTASYSVDDDSLVLFREVELKPTLKHPNGRYIITCGDKHIKTYERLPVATDQGKWNYSITDFHFDYIPGCFWSDAGVNNLISPQNTINEIDQALAINRKGVARPTLFIPGEIALKKIDHTGSVGPGMLALSYDPLLSGGQKPSIEQGTPLPQQILEERNIQRRTMQDVSGDPKNILRGESPGAKASGIMVDILRETAERGHYPDIERFTRSTARVNKKRLLLAQEIMTEERVLKIAGRGNSWKVRRFKASDLRNNTDVRMELDSGLASTNAGRMDLLLNFADRGFFGDPAQNPALRDEALRRAGLAGFTSQEDPDARRADFENAKLGVGDYRGIFLAAPNPQTGLIDPDSEVMENDPYFKYDNHDAHYEIHRKFILSDEFSELDQKAQIIAIHHTDAHHREIIEKQKNMPPPPHDPREFVQMDKLYEQMTRDEQIHYLEDQLGMWADKKSDVVGMVKASEKLDASIRKGEIRKQDTEKKESKKE